MESIEENIIYLSKQSEKDAGRMSPNAPIGREGDTESRKPSENCFTQVDKLLI